MPCSCDTRFLSILLAWTMNPKSIEMPWLETSERFNDWVLKLALRNFSCMHVAHLSGGCGLPSFGTPLTYLCISPSIRKFTCPSRWCQSCRSRAQYWEESSSVFSVSSTIALCTKWSLGVICSAVSWERNDSILIDKFLVSFGRRSFANSWPWCNLHGTWMLRCPYCLWMMTLHSSPARLTCAEYPVPWHWSDRALGEMIRTGSVGV